MGHCGMVQVLCFCWLATGGGRQATWYPVGTKPVDWKCLINDNLPLLMPEAGKSSASPVGSRTATPTGPGPRRQLGSATSTGLFWRYENSPGNVGSQWCGGTDRLRSDDSSVLRFSQVPSPTSLLAAERGKNYPLLLELELGTGICSWAWWDEVPDLVLASVCDPTELDGVNCEFGLYETLKVCVLLDREGASHG